MPSRLGFRPSLCRTSKTCPFGVEQSRAAMSSPVARYSGAIISPWWSSQWPATMCRGRSRRSPPRSTGRVYVSCSNTAMWPLAHPQFCVRMQAARGPNRTASARRRSGSKGPSCCWTPARGWIRGTMGIRAPRLRMPAAKADSSWCGCFWNQAWAERRQHGDVLALLRNPQYLK